ncbi:MAG: recombinase family protein, partial [Gaiellaceae bacterium]
KNVTFVSVTQSFNTTTSMGRLTLNILLSFAQFEREVTGERIRDKIAASKQKGMWMGGFVPLGYEARDRTLIINEAEAETVRTIFQLYLASGNVRDVEAEVARRGLRTRPRPTGGERMRGGRPFSRGHIYRILSNPLYIGEIAHKGSRYPGQHPAIIDRGIFDAVQARLRENTRGRRGRANTRESSLLSGLLFDETGNRFTGTHAVKNGRRYRYYVATAREAGKGSPVVRLSASAIEPVVVRQVAGLLRQAGRLIDELGMGTAPPDAQAEVMARAERLVADLERGRGEEQREILADLVERVTVGADFLRIEIGRTPLCMRLVGDEAPTAVEPGGALLIEAPLRIARRGGETKLVIDGEAASADRSPDPALVRSVAR